MSHYSGGTGSRTRFQTKVWLHVYDLSPANDMLWPVGLGLHHSGVEISGVEYSFASGAGIYESHTPTIVVGAKYRERVELGSFDAGSDRVKLVIDELKDTFGPDDYSIIRRNCNHFANALCWKLLQRKIPAYVNRASDLATCVSCLIPKKLLEQASVGDSNDEVKSTSLSFGHALNTRSRQTTTTAFSGTGRTLANELACASERKGLLSRLASNNAGPSSASEDLVDRREKIRQAALARLEQSQGQGLADKQS